MRECILFLGLSFLYCASSYGQSIYGVVEDEDGEPLSYCAVILLQDGSFISGMESDINGVFKFENVANGDYTLGVQYVGYSDFEQEIVYEGQNIKLSVVLKYDPTEICEFGPTIEIHPLKNHILSQRSNSIIVDQYSKDIAGTFGDPSRVLLRHTGISTQNDQANGIVYRGLSADNINWTISGAEIVNPNHLSNAGTLSDQSSASAGGVLAFPLETIYSFQFSGQPYGAQLPNALAGVANLNFNSNFRNRNSFFKLGLLGLEAGYVCDKKVKVNAHVRYSTVGLLSDLGVDFDGESIKFQDVFLNVGLTDNLHYIGLLANSTNDKAPIENPDINATEKDLSQINYKSDIMIHGLRFNNVKHNQSLFFSTKKDSRDVLFEMEQKLSVAEDMKLSYHGDYNFSDWQIGMNATYYNGLRQFDISDFDDSYLTVQPYLMYNKMKHFNGTTLSVRSSLSTFYDTYNKELSVEPYLQLQYANDSFIIELNASQKSQMQSPFLYGLMSIDNVNSNLERSKTLATSLSLKFVQENYRILSRVFYQYLYDLPSQVGTGNEYVYSPVMNGISFLTSGALDIQSYGRTYGVELMTDFDIGSQFYLNINTTLLDASYEDLNATNDFGHIFNLTMTKEIGDHFLINVAFHHRGGAYENQPFFREVYQEQLSDYYRVDTRVAYRWGDKNELSLDIQNLTSRQNDAYYSGDFDMQEVGPIINLELEKQLGIIPILSYKRLLN